MAAMAFQHLEIRPCIQITPGAPDSWVESFHTEAEYERALAALKSAKIPLETFWSIYGMYPLDVGAGAVLPLESVLIGDFDSKASAFVILNAMLAPLLAARDLIRARDSFLDASRAADALDDFVNMSSNHVRL
ncbi:UNVERIFIED_ORG: hypothetical protein LHK14_17900 [Roseateles sp. XES5]|nr:hypothetical protein [Roseateles sp. XES5]